MAATAGYGGSVYLRAAPGINTLADFRVERTFRAKHGGPARGNGCTGAAVTISTWPCPSARWCAMPRPANSSATSCTRATRCSWREAARAAGATTRFKSSTNRAPRNSAPGCRARSASLAIELKVIADVGLLGLPNAGKSTLISAVSAARPKIADYPFTTLYPNLGVVSVGEHRSFVMADIPGLIEGAAEGAGLGIRFLKHLQRTRVLLHLVDIAPPDPDADPVKDARAIVGELKKFSKDLVAKPRWLVLNKMRPAADEGSGAALRGNRPPPALEGAGLSHLSRHGRGHQRADAGRDAPHRRDEPAEGGRGRRVARVRTTITLLEGTVQTFVLIDSETGDLELMPVDEAL